MVLKLTHTCGDVEFVRVVDASPPIGLIREPGDEGPVEFAMVITLEDDEQDWIRGLMACERMPDGPFAYSHTRWGAR
jgi:hypothetical protein